MTLPKLLKSENREEQGEYVQELMQKMTDTFNEIFPPSEGDEEAISLNGEGIENCVMKNLYQDLFRHPSEAEFNKRFVR